ncbi:sensor histidine kinase [Clostridium lundense]|uniref:sensor histidine kinase n=1 Tax=Clostridium lundense TaxID=319475 RepID=UPI0004880868|nr:sensor histidine kinase [Clostridium lundense]
MSFSKLVLNTLKKEKGAIFLYLCNALVIMLYYYLLSDKQAISYPLMLTAIFLMCYLVYKFFIYRSLYTYLNEGKISPKYKIKEGYVFEDILDILREIHNDYISKIYRLESKYEDREKLLGEWIHNTKTSVAVIQLAAQMGKEKKGEEIFQDILEESIKLQENLEGALNVFRLQEFTKDYVPEKVDLKSLVNGAINIKKRNFIYGNVFPKVEVDEEQYIYTDKKWSSYVIEQIITNAVKYSSGRNFITFYSERNEKTTTLYIEDEGIGIKEHELGRVFDAFFTGSNGRNEVNRSKSSGIGLYMCKTICEILNSEITIESEEGKGTTVSISYLNSL